MDIIEEYIKIKHPLATTVYKDEIRAKFKSVDYKIIDFINLYLDKEGQKVAMEIIKKIYTMYVIKEGFVECCTESNQNFDYCCEYNYLVASLP